MKPAKSRVQKSKTIQVKSEFFCVDTRMLDSKNRITLKNRWYQRLGSGRGVDAYQVFVDREGDILLRPSVTVPSNEAWVYQNPKVIGAVRKGLSDASAGKIERADDLSLFLKGI